MVRGLTLALATGGVAALFLALGACSEAPKLVGEGAACATTTDCAFGLVCVPQKTGRICTGDVTSIATATPPPTDAGRDADADAGGRGGRPDGGKDASTDTGSPPPPQDAAPSD